MKNKTTKKVEYVVFWRESVGWDPCGRNEWMSRSKKFKTQKEARAHYRKIEELCLDRIKLTKVTIELLEESR